MRKLFYKAFGSIIASVVLVTGCNKPEAEQIGIQPNVKIASLEAFSPGTKTSIQDNVHIVWSKGDRIIVFDHKDSGQAYLLEDDSAGASSGRFTIIQGVGTEGSGAIFSNTLAYYPYDESVHVEKDGAKYLIHNITFPHEQIYAENGPAAESFPMLSINTDSNSAITFKNIGGIVRIGIKGSKRISRITLSGNSKEILSGSATGIITEGGKPSVLMDEGGRTDVSVICEPAVQLNEEKETYFHISTPPSEFAYGFTITIECSDGETFTKSTDKQNPVKRSSILMMPSFREMPTSGKCVDLGLSVKWGGWNIGAYSPEEHGNLYSWGEIEPKSTYSFDTYLYLNNRTGAWSYIGDEISGTQYDVASMKWGNGWRMPSRAEAEELIALCTKEHTRYNDIEGYFYIGPNGNSIFIPLIQCQNDNGSSAPNSYFWTSTYDRYYSNGQCAVYFDIADGQIGSWYRYIGMPIRPVTD